MITAERLMAWQRAFAYFATAWPQFAPHDEQELGDTIGVWDDLCEDVSTHDIVPAARELARSNAFSMTPGKLREIALGRLVKVPVHATDLYGARVKNCYGEPRVLSWCLVRVPHGRNAPDYLLEGEVPDGIAIEADQLAGPSDDTNLLPETTDAS